MRKLLPILIVLSAGMSVWAVGVRKGKPITIHVRRINAPAPNGKPWVEAHYDSVNCHSLTCYGGTWMPCIWQTPPAPTVRGITLAKLEEMTSDQAMQHGPVVAYGKTRKSVTDFQTGWSMEWRDVPGGYEYIYTEDPARYPKSASDIKRHLESKQ